VAETVADRGPKRRERPAELVEQQRRRRAAARMEEYLLGTPTSLEKAGLLN